MLQAFQCAPSLREFAAPVNSAWDWFFNLPGSPGILFKIAQNPTLQVVHIVARDSWDVKHWEYEVEWAKKNVGRIATGQSISASTLEQVLGLVHSVSCYPTGPRRGWIRSE